MNLSRPVSCTWAGEELLLLPDRAVYWPRQHALIITDPHFGKASAFRHSGIPVPMGTTPADLARLTSLIAQTEAKQLIILGDFFHHRTGQCDRTMTLLAQWRQAHSSLNILLVMGNHDRSSDEPPPEWNIRLERRPVEFPPFLLCHEPCRKEGLFVLCGHVHPSVSLRDPIGHALRVPCYWFGSEAGMLPAFGGFTGSAKVHPVPGDQVFGIVEDQIIPIPVKSARRAFSR